MQITLRAARVNAGFTQTDVSKQIKRDKSTIIAWEKGRKLPGPAELCFLCRLYNVKENDIFLPTE